MSAPRARIRPALAHELEPLSQLALRSKAIWGYSEEMLAAFREELTLHPRELRETFVREVEGRVVGFYSLQHLSEERVELGYLFVEPAEVRRGHGMALLRDAFERAREAGYGVLEIQGDPHAVGFYTAAGATRVGERESDSIPGRMLPLFEVPLSSV